MPTDIVPLHLRFRDYVLCGFYVIPISIVLGLVLASGMTDRLLAIAGLHLVFGAMIAETRRGSQNAVAGLFDMLKGVSGSSTPYSYDYSREQAMVMRNDVEGALASYESHMANGPENVDVRLRAAELYATKGAEPRRAAALFIEARRIPGATTEQDVYATNRLIDLYRGALAEPGRALVELRRLIDRHPGTRIAANARDALAELKSSVKSAESPEA